jgi:hypothetical protein
VTCPKPHINVATCRSFWLLRPWCEAGYYIASGKMKNGGTKERRK